MQDTDGIELKYIFRLYVSGLSLNSKRSIENLKKLCDTKITGKYEMEVIDIYQYPDLVMEDNILAIPTLLRLQPVPVVKIVGDLSNTHAVMKDLDING